ISTALYRIHRSNLVHRDLHPGNILQKFDGSWRISDLGFCDLSRKEKNHFYGNLPYCAPEVINNGEYTIKSDIYSIGMLMYEVVTGMPPFYDQRHENLAINILCGIRPTIPKGIPESYLQLMCNCWKSNPEDRPS
ncbi:kinase-like domain-containing protein, partial [Gigaspora rosea]